jgi:hypothetical protein
VLVQRFEEPKGTKQRSRPIRREFASIASVDRDSSIHKASRHDKRHMNEIVSNEWSDLIIAVADLP